MPAESYLWTNLIFGELKNAGILCFIFLDIFYFIVTTFKIPFSIADTKEGK